MYHLTHLPKRAIEARSRLSRLSMSMVAAVALTAPGGSTLGAQAPTVYFACYVPSSGTVYRIKVPNTPQSCASSTRKGVTEQHVEFSWTDGAGAVRITDAAGGDLSGPLGSPAVAKLLGRVLSTTPPADGQVLTWNQAANAWEAKAPAGGGAPSDHGALAGLGDDDHPQYLLVDGNRNSTNGFAITGTLGTGSLPTSDAGLRFMWYPAKAAFRVGENEFPTTEASYGLHSIAVGYNAGASGDHGVALGWQSRANGSMSVGLGGGMAIGGASFAVGNATALDTRSVAMGFHASSNAPFGWAVGTNVNTNGKGGGFAFGDASTMGPGTAVTPAADNQFVVRAQRFWFGTNNNVTATAGRLIETSTGAYLSSGGTWTNSSDSARKTAFHDVDGDSVLAKIATLPVRTWSYRDEDSTVRHIGPTAQDFRATFALGQSDKAIATVDADGVSLAGLQALLKRTDRLARDNESLGRANASLRSELDLLDDRVRNLEAVLSQLSARGSDETSLRSNRR